jgi:hypothetical protein
MGLLLKLFSGSPQSAGQSHFEEVDPWLFDDCDQLIAAVGVSHYQLALAEICGSEHWERVRFDCQAALVPEPDNPYDANAVRVFANCRGSYIQVGYLSRRAAVEYGPAVRRAAELGCTIACQGHIAGREEGSETPNLGVFLDLPTPDACMGQLGEPLS